LWHECRAYLYGIDLFNHGYFWEAHEAWEGVWRDCGRRGTTADFLKGLIHLAAAGVKAKEQRQAGVASHGRRAAELFHALARDLSQDHYMGLSLRELETRGQEVADASARQHGRLETALEPAFAFYLMPT
jgi:predicted metal-dependent hydrolase